MSAIRATACVLLALTLLGVGAPEPTASAAPTTSHWHWPTSPPGTVVQGFEAPATPYAAGHRGIDLAATPGQTVLAPTDSVITFTGVVVDRPVVTLRVDEHVLVSFEPVATELPLGSELDAGSPLGVVANGGHCDSRCVHIGVRVDGEYVSPLLFFAGVPPAVLLPLN